MEAKENYIIKDMVIKIYKCKICKEYEGTKESVRKHIREDHLPKQDFNKHISKREFK